MTTWFLIVMWAGSTSGFSVGPFDSEKACYAAKLRVEQVRPPSTSFCVAGSK